jgi:hypothetical protein
LRRDHAVVRDPRSPSSWAFRSSYQRAVQAFVRAFELAPALHRGFQADAYFQIRRMLYTERGILRPGSAVLPDTTRFYAYAEWMGDSLAFTPYPSLMITRGQVPTDRAARRTAIEHQRALFAGVARSWATALPNNAGAKEAVAIALEMLGEPSALDTLRRARLLAEDPLQQLRLAAEEVLLETAQGRNAPEHLAAAVRLGDSLLTAHRPSRGEESAILAPVASLLGKCRKAGALGAWTAGPKISERAGVPYSAYAAAESVTILGALGCSTRDDIAGYETIAQSLRAGARDSSRREADQREYMFLGRAVRLAFKADSARVVRLAAASGDAMLGAEAAVMTGHPEVARSFLEARRKARGIDGTADITPDAVYSETLLWLSIGDTASAKEWLDPILNRPTWLELMLNDGVGAATLVRAASLRAELAYLTNEPVIAKRWADFVVTLSPKVEPELAPLVRRMRKIAGR